MVDLYVSPSCTSCRKARAWLEKHNIPFKERNIFSEPLTKKELLKILRMTENGTEEIISTRSRAFQQLRINLDDLSIDQISKIFKGEVTSWKDVGGADTPIVLIGREAGSGTRDGFETITNTKDSCKYRQELTSTGDVMTVVSKNENAIGYISLASMNDKVKGVTVEGVAATEPTIADGTYKIQRPFVLVTKKGAQLSEGAQKFIDFAFSEEAKPILIKAGVVPVAKK